jgi:hypothetical protein
VFSEAGARLQSFPGKFKEDSAVNLENQGGLEIQSFNGIRLDSGWKKGGEAYKNPEGMSVFSDAHNKTCQIKNKEFFFYDDINETPEPIQKYPDDKSLEQFLQERCPNLDLSPLHERFASLLR